MPTVTEIKSGGRMDFLGILEANDGSIWFGSGGGVYRCDGKTITDFRRKEDQYKRPYFSATTRGQHFLLGGLLILDFKSKK